MFRFTGRDRRRLLATAAAVAIGAAALPSAASAEPNVVDGGIYRIVPTHNNPASKTLEVPGASTANSGQIIQNTTPLFGSTAHQRFRVTPAGTTGSRPYFRIRSTHVANKCFDVQGGSIFNSAKIIQFDCISGNRNPAPLPEHDLPGLDRPHDHRASQRAPAGHPGRLDRRRRGADPVPGQRRRPQPAVPVPARRLSARAAAPRRDAGRVGLQARGPDTRRSDVQDPLT